MKNVMPGTSCINSAAQLSAHRRSLIELLGAAQVITTAEYEVAAQNIITCQALATLQKWHRNCVREIARREEALQPTAYEAAQLAYRKAEAASRRLTARRNSLFEQLAPMRPDGFPVYAYSENPNRSQLDAAHQAAMQAIEKAKAAWEQVLVAQAQQCPAPVVYATVDQTQEIQRLLNHVSITRREKTQVLRTLPQLDHAQAKATIGSLWAKILSRAGDNPPADGWSRRGNEEQRSYSIAA